MGVKAGIAKFSDLLGQKLNAVSRVTKDDGLVNLELGEERVQAMNFLAFLNECIILRHATQCELVHEIDFVWLHHVLVLEVFDNKRERCRK